jgi:hypothetical protein
MTRLVSAGLSRHDAVHAMGSVFAEQMLDLVRDTFLDARPMANDDAAAQLQRYAG